MIEPNSTPTKFIFVTGGVVSSLGKGIAAASLGRLLVQRGLKVTRLARGVPAGSELEYVDLGTIAHALVDRR